MDFAAMFQSWMNVLFHPGEAAFEEELAKPQAKLSTAIIWVVIAGVIAAVFSMARVAVQSLVMGGGSMWQPILSEMPPEMQREFGQYLMGSAGLGVAALGGAFCMSLIMIPVGFLIGSLIWFVLAKIFGGDGDFEGQTYLMATYTAPLMIVNSVISIIPFLGACVAFFLWIYQIALTYFMLKVSHNLSSGKALTIVLLPVILLLLCIVCGMIAMIVSVMGAAAGGNF